MLSVVQSTFDCLVDCYCLKRLYHVNLPQKLVELMQGKLTVSSAPEKGSIFEFTCKVGIGGDSPDSLAEPNPEMEEFGIDRLNGVKILIVDWHPVRQVGDGFVELQELWSIK